MSTSEDQFRWSVPHAILDTPFTRYAEAFPTLAFLQDSSGVFRLVISPPDNYPGGMILASSLEGDKWTSATAPFEGNQHPSLAQDSSGRFDLVFGGGTAKRALHQVRGLSWTNWEEPVYLPDAGMCGFTNTSYDNPSMVISTDGYHWIASRNSYQPILQIYRLKTFPAKEVFDAWTLDDSAPKHFRLHLERDELYKEFQSKRE